MKVVKTFSQKTKEILKVKEINNKEGVKIKDKMTKQLNDYINGKDFNRTREADRDEYDYTYEEMLMYNTGFMMGVQETEERIIKANITGNIIEIQGKLYQIKCISSKN